MEKKRRYDDKWRINTIELSCMPFEEAIGDSMDKMKNGTCICTNYVVKSELGVGNIMVYELPDFTICIRNMELKKSIVRNIVHSLTEAQLSFLLSGEVLISPMEGEEIIYEGQESYLARTADFRGQIIISGSKPFHEIVLKMNQRFLTKSGLYDHGNLKYFLDSSLILPIDSLVLRILRSMEPITMTGLSQSLFLEAKTMELIACQLEYYKKIAAKQGCLPLHKDSKLKKLYRVKQLLETNPNKNYIICYLAKGVGINEFDLKKQFKETFGCSVNSYARSIKMEEAKNLLSLSNMPVYEVAELVGYKNATHFSAAFKKYFGITPKVFKRGL